jgi:deoxycytidine triphosphate deaminase
MNKPNWPKLTDGCSNAPEILVDLQIADAISRGQLISQEADAASTKYACYELRIGDKVQQLVMDGAPDSESDLYREKDIGDSGIITINPGQTFKIYSKEELYMPADVLAITIPVGNLYKLGLNPETSFADPGFSGSFYVTVCNYSPRVVKLKVGDGLARVFFFHLAQRPNRIHDSKPREIRPSIERVKRPDIGIMEQRGEVALLSEILATVDPPHYEHAFVTNRLVSLHRVAIENTIRQLQRESASVTLASIASLLLILIIAVLYLGSFGAKYFPTLTGHVLEKLLVAFILWFIAVVVGPLKKASRSALHTVLRPG